jgi:hypothetical protein
MGAAGVASGVASGVAAKGWPLASISSKSSSEISPRQHSKTSLSASAIPIKSWG